jgi:hypothetical protein
MALRAEYKHSWQTYLSLNNKRDLKGNNLTDQQKLELNAFHPLWDQRAHHTALVIRHRIGDDAFLEFQDYLPEEMDSWSPQQFSFAFDRVLTLIESAGIGNTPSPVEMAIVAAAGQVSIHPYEQHKHIRLCPECAANVAPAIMDMHGYLYRCECGNIWRHTDQAASDRWQEHIEDVKERYFSHLTG